MNLLVTTLAVTALASSAAPQTAQPQPAGAPVTLADAYRAATSADPRARQLVLEEEQAALRLRTLETERLPSLRVEARGQHQSDVASFPLRDASGMPLITPAKTTADAFVGLEQRILDPTRAARAAVVRAELVEARARVEAALFGLRQEVDEAFFAAASAGARAGAIAIRIAALEQLKAVADARVREGAALPGEARAIEAAILMRRQDHLQATLARRAGLDRLSRLTAGAISRDSALDVSPALAASFAGARARLADARSRPEYAVFDATRETLRRREDAVAAADDPRVSAFARAGAGRPGLNFIDDGFNAYWLAGVQLQWAPWSWGARAREREALGIAQQVVATEAAAFSARLARTVDAGLTEVERLEGALALDEQIVALRRQIEEETRIRWEARVISLAEYLDRSGELLDAELAREERRVALDAARARLLTAAGVEVK